MRITATIMIMALAFPVAGATLSLVNPVVAKPNIPTNTINFADYGEGDGKTLNTVAFEKALAVLAGKGGGRLIVPLVV